MASNEDPSAAGGAPDDAWRRRARALRPRLRSPTGAASRFDGGPGDAAAFASAFASWPRAYLATPPTDGDGEKVSGRRTLEALVADRRFDAPRALAAQCAAYGGRRL